MVSFTAETPTTRKLWAFSKSFDWDMSGPVLGVIGVVGQQQELLVVPLLKALKMSYHISYIVYYILYIYIYIIYVISYPRIFIEKSIDKWKLKLQINKHIEKSNDRHIHFESLENAIEGETPWLSASVQWHTAGCRSQCAHPEPLRSTGLMYSFSSGGDSSQVPSDVSRWPRRSYECFGPGRMCRENQRSPYKESAKQSEKCCVGFVYCK